MGAGGRTRHRRYHRRPCLCRHFWCGSGSPLISNYLRKHYMKYLLSLDQGTTSSRALVIDYSGKVIAVAQKEFTQFFPQPGWVEHDANEIWASQIGVAADAIGRAAISHKEIAAIGITNQRETAVVWDRHSGEPVGHAIVWQDRRTAPICDQMRADGLVPLVQKKTGLVIDAY